MVLRILHPILASTLCAANPLARIAELLHGPEQIADLPVPVAESPGMSRPLLNLVG